MSFCAFSYAFRKLRRQNLFVTLSSELRNVSLDRKGGFPLAGANLLTVSQFFFWHIAYFYDHTFAPLTRLNLFEGGIFLHSLYLFTPLFSSFFEHFLSSQSVRFVGNNNIRFSFVLTFTFRAWQRLPASLPVCLSVSLPAGGIINEL